MFEKHTILSNLDEERPSTHTQGVVCKIYKNRIMLQEQYSRSTSAY